MHLMESFRVPSYIQGPTRGQENQSNFSINIHYGPWGRHGARFIAICPTNFRVTALRRRRLNFVQIAVIVNMHSIAKDALPLLRPLYSASDVCYGNFMKSFHTISYVRRTQQVFIASACLKVPSQKAKNSKLFFHCNQLPTTSLGDCCPTTTYCIE